MPASRTSSSGAGRSAATAAWDAQRIDAMCDAFEEAIRSGAQPRIADYLGDCAGKQRESLFAELLLVELELGGRPADGSSYQRYLSDYPEFAEVIETIAFKHGLNTAPDRPGARQGALDPAAAAPTRVAHFQLQEKLGAGGMGEVWRAWDTRLKRPVAVKIPRNRQLSQQELHRFLREGRAAAQLKHPSIVPVHEVGRDGDLAFIVSELIEGQSLQQWLEGTSGEQSRHTPPAGADAALCDTAEMPASHGAPAGETSRLGPSRRAGTPVPATDPVSGRADHPRRTVPAPGPSRDIAPGRAAELCAQLADALHHAHEHGIVHRDLKPSNVLIGADGQPHIVDFGIAKWADDTRQLTLDGYAVGTPAYMSPEQARGDSASVDRRADVYALGAILYRLLTGRVPFAGDSPAAVLRAVLDDTPRPPRAVRRDIPRDLETICLKAMEKDPARRYATARALEADLARFLRGDPIVGRRPGLLEKSVRWIRRRPGATAAVALGLLAAGAVGVAGVLARERAQQGWLNVTLETNPPGARVVFVPLDEKTAEPQGDKAVQPAMRSPVEVELQPGDYLVVAALDDGRFHEVFRHVPQDRREMTTINRHQRWNWKDEEVVLPAIDIPERNVTSGMAVVRPQGEAPAFYMDTHEANYIDCPQCVSPETNEPPPGRKFDRPITVHFDRACHFAEKMGKRLPTAAEFERAAVLAGRFQCAGDQAKPKEFGPAGTPECDVVVDPTPITGLFSNVAEWTTTALPGDPAKEIKATPFAGRVIPPAFLTGLRIVKGGDMTVVDGDPTLAPEHRDPSRSTGVARYQIRPGLGFRCVRSERPRFLKD